MMMYEREFSSQRKDPLQPLSQGLVDEGSDHLHLNSDDDGTTHDATATYCSSSRVQRHEHPSSSKIHSSCNGYTADASSNSRIDNNDSSNSDLDGTSDQSSSDSKLGWVIDISKQERPSRRSLRQRHKPRNRRNDVRISPFMTTRLSVSVPLPKPAPSPVHPDIDISLTRHVTTSDLMVGPEIISAIPDTLRKSRSASHSVSSLMAIEALSSFVLNCLGSSTSEVAPVVSSSRTAGVAPPSLLPHSGSALLEGKVNKEPATAAVVGGPGLRQELPSLKRKHSSNKSHTRKRMTLSPLPGTSVPSNMAMVPQVISDVATFSTCHYTLEDALDLTDTPRVLLEATPPHRVIHANSAFSTEIIHIGRKSNGTRDASSSKRSVQDWMEQRNKACRSRTTIGSSRSLEKAIEDVLPDNANIPFTCYPVLGAGRVTHYLLEATKNDNKSSPSAPSVKLNDAMGHNSGSNALDVYNDGNCETARKAFHMVPSQAIG